MKKLAILILLLLSCRMTAENMCFKHIGGLPQNTVLCSMQDSRGFMWFGTKDGLCRYDGYEFKIYNFSKNYISSLMEDSDNNIWIGALDGVYIFDTHKDRIVPFDKATEDGVRISGEIHCIRSDSQGNIWIAAYWKGLFKYEKESGKLSYICYTDGTESGLSSNGIWDVVIDETGLVWIGTVGGGLNLYNPEDNTIEFFRLTHNGRNDIMAMLPVGGNRILLGTPDDGILSFNKETRTITPMLNSPEGNMYVRSILKDMDGTLWIGTETGLYHYRQETGELSVSTMDYSNRYALSSNAVYSLCQDADGGLWVGTYFGGLDYLSPYYDYVDYQFAMAAPTSLSGNAVREFVEDEKGNLWIGTEDNGLNYFSPSTGEFVNYTPSNSGISYHNVHGLCLDGDRLYIGYFMHGMDILDTRTGRIRNHFGRGLPGDISDNNVMAIARDRERRIWVGTVAGLNLFDPISGHFSVVDEVGPNLFVTDIFEDSRGIVWVATNSDYVFFLSPSNGEWTHLTDVNKSITSITEDSHGNIWLPSANGGVSVWNRSGGECRTYTKNDGLGSNTVHRILCDVKGRIWASTNNGLFLFEDKYSAFKAVSPYDDLLCTQFNYKSGIAASDGRLFFGSINGFISFDPNIQAPEKEHPNLVISRFEVFNAEVTPSSENAALEESIIYSPSITLNHKQTNFGFDFSLLNFENPGRNTYFYRLRGLDKDWINAVAQPHANYANVRPGKYVFEVKATDASGRCYGPECITLSIRPPFYLSVAGIVLESFLILFALMAVLYFYRRTEEKKREVAIAKIKSEQEISSQKARLAFFTNMTHELRTPLALITAPFEQIYKSGFGDSDVKENLEIMGANISRLVSVTNEVLDYSKIENNGMELHLKMTDINDAVSQSVSSFRLAIKERGLKLTMDIPESHVLCFADSEVLIKIFTNLVNNAVKYADTYIKVSLVDDTPSQGWFRFRISNDSSTVSSINPENIFKPFFQEKDSYVPGGFGLGLPLVKQLSELHHGSIKMDINDIDDITFSVDIPRQDIPQEDPMPEEIFQSEEPGDRTLLLVEDDNTMRRFICKELAKNYNVVACQNGEEALAALENNEIDIIVTDLRMPKMDGLQLCKLLKAKIEFSHIPVIMLTAYGDSDTVIKALEEGVDAYIEKPFSIDHLNARIVNLLSKVEHLRLAFRENPGSPADEIATNPTDAAFLKEVTEIILKHNEDPDFSTDKLAGAMNMSRSTLYRKLKEIAGMMPNEFIRICRLKHAASLLDKGTYRIQEICYLAGFNSPSYFTKCFQQQFKMTPKEYQKKKR